MTGGLFRSANINSIGLILDVIGVLLLLKGLPPLINMSIEKNNEGKMLYVWELEDEIDQERMRKYYMKYECFKIIFPISAVLITLGFVLQIWSNYLS